MILTICFYIMLFCSMFVVAFNCIILYKNQMPTFYKVVTYGLFGFMLTRVFLVLLIASGGNENDFSLGVLGQVCAYMFFSIANSKYVPREGEDRLKVRLCVPAMIFAFVLAGMYVLAAAVSGTLGAIVSEVLYAFSVSSSAYWAIRNIVNQYHNAHRRCLTGFNICLCILAFCNAAYELVLALSSSVDVTLLTCVLSAGSGTAMVMSVILLKKGMIRWKEIS